MRGGAFGPRVMQLSEEGGRLKVLTQKDDLFASGEKASWKSVWYNPTQQVGREVISGVFICVF